MKLKFSLYTRKNQLVVDAVICATSFAAAYLIRYEGMPPWPSTKQFMLWIPYIVTFRLLVNWRFGIYRFIWKYVSLSEVVIIGQALSVVTVLLVLLRLFYPHWGIFSTWLRLPLPVIALEFLLTLTGSLGARALRRILYDRGKRITLESVRDVKRVLLYGAGRAGILLLKELKSHPETDVVGFVDDDPYKVGTVISGVKVLGRSDSLEELAQRLRIDEVVVSIAAPSRDVLTPLLERCDVIGLAVKIIPSLHEIVAGHVSISHTRDVHVEDLLGRESFGLTEVDAQVQGAYAGKRILVTGAGGSIGSELVRQLVALKPGSLVVLDKDENGLYELEQEIAFRSPETPLSVVVGDLRHRERLVPLFRDFRPHVVFHAAAHKHVPLMEKNPCEAVLNNVAGTKTLLEICRHPEMERLVFISSDKAVNPTNVMGATKRVGELLVQAFAEYEQLPSVCVRFGNVMDSRGSVIPLFRKQIREGGPITVTHPDVVRFFMTIPEAVQLILCAGILGTRGEVFVLDMGNPRKILDLAHEMARLSGLEPGKDIDIAITGLRPGEKLVEELLGANESIRPTRFEKVLMIVPQCCDGRQILASVLSLVNAAHCDDRDGVYRVLTDMGLQFKLADNGSA